MPEKETETEETESESWQFQGDHLNVQTIRALILETKRCVCAAGYHSHLRSIHTHSPQLVSGKVHWSSQNALIVAVVGRLSIAVDIAHSHSMFSSCVEIQTHSLLLGIPLQLNAQVNSQILDTHKAVSVFCFLYDWFSLDSNAGQR